MCFKSLREKITDILFELACRPAAPPPCPHAGIDCAFPCGHTGFHCTSALLGTPGSLRFASSGTPVLRLISSGTLASHLASLARQHQLHLASWAQQR